jgi:hypothetical protein
MFTKFSLLFAVVIFGYACSALNPIAFVGGINHALNIENDPKLTQCVLKLAQLSNLKQAAMIGGFDEVLETCEDASHTFLRALARATYNNTQYTDVENLALALLSADGVIETLKSHNDYEAGQQIIKFLVHALKTVEQAIINLPDKFNANKTELLLGFADALNILHDDLAFAECVEDYNQVQDIMNALQANLSAGNYTQAINEFIIFTKFAPKFSAACSTIERGVLSFIKPIVGSFIKHPVKSVETLVHNIISEPFTLVAYALTAVKDLQSHHDRQAGQTLGALVLTILENLH